jgi:virginiamycin B lyase
VCVPGVVLKFAVAGAIIFGVGLYGCGGDDGSDTSTSAAGSTTGTADVEKVDLRKAGATAAPIDADWLVGTDDAVWTSAGGEFIRLDPETGKESGAVSVPAGLCLRPVYAFGSLYSATCYSQEGLVRIDPEKLEVTNQIRVPTPDIYNQEGTVAATDDAIWVIIDGKGCKSCVLAGFDPKTLKMTHEVDFDQSVQSVAAGDGVLWVADSERNRVLRVDQQTDEVVGETEVGGLPRYVAVDENGVWAYNQLEGSVTQLDPETAEPIRTIETDMPGAGGAITVGDGSVWVRGTLTLLKQVDSETGEIVAQYGPDAGSGDALVRDGVLWISAIKALGHGTEAGGGAVYRLPLSKVD